MTEYLAALPADRRRVERSALGNQSSPATVGGVRSCYRQFVAKVSSDLGVSARFPAGRLFSPENIWLNHPAANEIFVVGAIALVLTASVCQK